MKKYTSKGKLVKEIRKLMLEDGVTTAELAEEIGQTRQALHKTFTSSADIKVETIRQIVGALGYEFHYEFIRKDEKAE